MLLSKNKTKHLLALQQKKYRQKQKSFVVEGEKIAQEVLTQQKYKIRGIYATTDWIDSYQPILNPYRSIITTVTSNELKKISSLKTPNKVLLELDYALTEIPTSLENSSLQLVLENIQDPGNLGTIIRIADWFGIQNIFCSIGCVDIYNPKVIQATMGGFLRINTFYTKIEDLLEQYPHLPVYGAVLNGQNIFESQLKKEGFLLIGNEGRGLSDNILSKISHPITIPKYGKAESLNAAVATGILCALFQK
jgi:TrmH family RNA methyltransferase